VFPSFFLPVKKTFIYIILLKAVFFSNKKGWSLYFIFKKLPYLPDYGFWIMVNGLWCQVQEKTYARPAI